MIEKEGRYYILQCDYCSNSVDDFEEFQEVVNYKKVNGWKSINIKGGWTDKCPNCINDKNK